MMRASPDKHDSGQRNAAEEHGDPEIHGKLISGKICRRRALGTAAEICLNEDKWFVAHMYMYASLEATRHKYR